jgi:hypothetical protein
VAYPLARHGAKTVAHMLPFDKLRTSLCLSMTPPFLVIAPSEFREIFQLAMKIIYQESYLFSSCY